MLTDQPKSPLSITAPEALADVDTMLRLRNYTHLSLMLSGPIGKAHSTYGAVLISTDFTGKVGQRLLKHRDPDMVNLLVC